MKYLDQKGQVIIEAVVALGAAVVIIGVITVVVVTSLSNSELAKNQNLATQYAQQAIETARELSETNWVSFYQSREGYCLDNNSKTFTQPEGASNTCKMTNSIFTRQVTIQITPNSCSNLPSAAIGKVVVVVGWNDSKCTSGSDLYCHKVKLESCFTNLKTMPAI
jgi:type II secretory pathway pseudopilin PulG